MSGGVRAALAALQETSSMAEATQTRLSTGLRVNSALDNPSSFFTAASLNNRSNDLSRLLDDMGQGIQVLKAADKGIAATQRTIESIQSVLRQALQSSSTTGKLTGTNTNTLTASTKLTNAAIGNSANDVYKIKVGSAAAVTVHTVTVDTTVQDLIDGINKNTSVNADVRASLDTNGKFVIESLSGQEITFSAQDTASTPANIINELMGGSVVADLKATAGTVNSTRKASAEQLSELLSQLDQQVNDASYNGINLLKGENLKITFNETSTSTLTVKGAKSDFTSLGLAKSTANLQSDDEINNFLTGMTSALTTLRTRAATFGTNLSIVQNRQDFTKNIVSTLDEGRQKLVQADTNQEAATLLALNTRQQLSSTALTLANQSDQQVLRLFG
jgi:flagellin-like hook-associated protein FlgL